MDIFEGRYFSFNRKLFVYMGLWPYGPKTRIIRKYLILLLLFLSIIPQFLSIVLNFSDLDRVMLNIVSCGIASLMFSKDLAMILAEDKLKGLYRNIADNWLAITDEKEKEILMEYSERGRKKAIYYFVIVQIGVCSLYVCPTIPKILNIIHPLPDPRQNIYILESELFIDREVYYWLYYLSDTIACFAVGTASVCIDSIYLVCVEHCCALYAIIRYRLRNLGSKIFNSSTETEINSADYAMRIILLHQNTVNFTETVNKTFTALFLFLLLLTLALIPLLAVTVLTNMNNPFNLIRFTMLFILVGTHLFMFFWPAQNVLDHGTDLIQEAYSNEWYTTSVRTRKLLIICMLRYSQPVVFTAGGLMLMNYETFAKIVKTSLSYITVVASFR